MKFFCTLLMVFCCSALVFSQDTEECFIPKIETDTAPLHYSERKLPQRVSDFEPVTFNIYFWGFRLEDNTGNVAFNQENIDNAVRWLNEIYNQCNVSFNLLGTEIILSDEHYILENQIEFLSMIRDMRSNGYVREDAFNIYVSNQYFGFGGAAAAYFDTLAGIPAVKLIDSGTIQHEVGHCFSLLHTNQIIDATNCESATRDPNNKYYNADITGDLVTDTDACYIFTSEIDTDSCTLSSNRNDCFGYPYTIPSSLLHNYMTIGAPSCTKDQFTNGQFVRIRQAIELDPEGKFSKARVD